MGVRMPVFLVFGLGGGVAVLGGALALGLRHGIDWDHIAAITDITSTATADRNAGLESLTSEPGLLFSDESQHGLSLQAAALSTGGSAMSAPEASSARAVPAKALQQKQRPLLLGTLYAAGHGTMVIVLGIIAIVFAGILPSWIDLVMERIVGLTLILLAAFLIYSLFRHLRGGGEFRLRSRWMLVFSLVGALSHRLGDRVTGREHHHHAPDPNQQYGVATAFSVGLIHGVGAETGSQVLIIGTAVGADSKGMAIATLFVFVAGLLVSNSVVTLGTAFGLVSAHRQRWLYISVGVLAAVFSLVVGLLFLFESGSSLPNLDPYFRWLGGPD